MKQIIIDSLSNNKVVTFVFSKGNSYSSDTLVDELTNEKDYIHVAQRSYTDTRIINLSMVESIRIQS
ncbi:hypothetical protein EH68_02320 [Enterococcus gallinarum]|nr:hypothetical protein [Enterococcus gallinarum]KIL82490.1 hypothetical protein EH68_02320 [Enterococcus gallinarum]